MASKVIGPSSWEGKGRREGRKEGFALELCGCTDCEFRDREQLPVGYKSLLNLPEKSGRIHRIDRLMDDSACIQIESGGSIGICSVPENRHFFEYLLSISSNNMYVRLRCTVCVCVCRRCNGINPT